MCVTTASAPTHQAPSSVSASLATICQETGADARVSGAEGWELACSSLPQGCPGLGSKPGTPLSSIPSRSNIGSGVWARPGALGEAFTASG